MDGTLVMPDVTTPAGKENKKLEKVYSPFLMKFFNYGGVLPKAISKVLEETVMIQLIQLLKIVDNLADKLTVRLKDDEKNEEKDSEKKKKSWIVDKWQKIIKSNFFQKTIGFLKSLASVSFVTTLLTFLVLLRMGIIQRFIPFIISVVGDAIISLIKFLPQLAKIFWKILTETLPAILKEIFRTIFSMLGIENKTLLKFADFIADWLPLIVAGAWLISTLMPIISAVGAAISLLASPITLIVIAVVALVALVWTFRKEIWEFLKWIGNAFYDYVIKPIVKYFKWMGGLYYKYLVKPFIKAVKWIIQKNIQVITIFFNLFKKGFKALTDFFYKIFIAPVKSLFASLASVAAPVIEKVRPIIEFISKIFTTIKNKIETVFKSISDTISELFAWFAGAGAFGGVDWMRLDEGQRSRYASKKAKLEKDRYVQAAQQGISVEQAKKEGLITTEEQARKYQELLTLKQENPNADIASILAAQSEGILKFLDGVKDNQEGRASNALSFVQSNTGTKDLSGK